jgi:cellulose synthase operon protein C
MNEGKINMMRSNYRPSLCLVLPVLFALAACSGGLTPDERMEVARGSLEGGDAATALIHLRNVLQADPANVEARILLAEAAFATGDFETAAKEYLRAVDLGADIGEFRARLAESLVRAGGLAEALRFTDPAEAGDDAAVSFWRAGALGGTGELKQARALLEGLRGTAGMAGQVEVALARLSLASQRTDEALATLEPLAESMAQNADYWEVKAFASLQAGEPETAVEAFRQASRVVVDALGQRRFMFAAGEAEALLAAGRIEEARAKATELQKAASRHPVANYLMARVELQSGNADQALAYAQAILAVQPDSGIGNMMAGAATLSMGQASTAERYLERAVASEPGNIPARKLLAQTRLGLESPERALEALTPVLGDSADPGLAALAGVARVRAGDAEAGIDIFRRQLANDPGNEETRVMLAVSLMSAGRTEEALAELSTVRAGNGVLRQRADVIAISAHLNSGDLREARSLAAAVAAAAPEDAAVHGALGALFQGGGQLDEAAAWFEQTLVLSPNNTAAAYNLARIRASRGQVEGAIELLDGVLAREPNNAVVLTARAQLDWARDERETALGRLEKARTTDPGDASSRFILVQYLVASGRAREAVPVAEELVAIAPGVAAGANALGMALLEAGEPREALPRFERARELDALEPRYLFNSARAHLSVGEPEPARVHLVNGLALAPQDTALLAALVDLDRRTGRLDAAAQALARLERVASPDDPRVALLRAEMFLAKERFADAEQAFTEAARLGIGNRSAIGQFETRRRGSMPDPVAPLRAWLDGQPGDIVVRRVLADYYIGANEQASAIGEYEILLQAAPDNAMILNNLAWLYGEASNPRGLELANRAHELAPGNAMIADTLGWILHQRGENDRARELLAAAVAGAPQASDIRYRYAVVLAETGDRSAAIREARAVLSDSGAVNYHDDAQNLLRRLERGAE